MNRVTGAFELDNVVVEAQAFMHDHHAIPSIMLKFSLPDGTILAKTYDLPKVAKLYSVLAAVLATHDAFSQS